MTRLHRSSAAVLALSFATLASAGAQGIRITAATTARYVDLRPWVDDSVSVDSTTGTSILRQSTRGVIVRCGTGEAFCRYRRSANSAVSTVPLLQDLRVSAWGLGEGIRLYAHVRARAAVGEADDVWPRADDPFDLLAAYAEIDRRLFRARAGRQFKTSGFGFYNFDGAALTVLPREDLEVEVFGGLSLERGLNEPPTSSEIAAVEEIPPAERGILFGVEARVRPTTTLSLGAAYQREALADRSGLYSERVAADAELRIGRFGTVSGDIEFDLGTGWVNDAWLRGSMPVRSGVTVEADLRRYRPFFPLWTIWGAFSPVGYTEANAGGIWESNDARFTLDARAGWRQYDETEAGLESAPMKDDGWFLDANGMMRLQEHWLVHAGWRTEIGFGASRTDLDGGVRWQPGRRAHVGARLTAFQSAFELRVGTGRVIGAGLDAGIALRNDLRLLGDVALYRHTYEDQAPTTDWSQTRASLRFEWSIGRDPGELPPATGGGPR